MKTLSSSKIVSAFLALVVSLVFSACSSNSASNIPNLADAPSNYDQDLSLRKQTGSHVGEGTGVKLSEALLKNLRSEAITPERLRLVREVIRGQSGKHHSDLAFQNCTKKFNNAQECNFLKADWVDSWFDDGGGDDEGGDTEIALKVSQRNSKVKLTRNFHRSHSKVLDQLVKNLKNGKLDKVPNQVEGDYYRAFKRFDAWTPELANLAQLVLKQSNCQDAELYTYLGLKGEEYFPNEELLKSSTDIYFKADQCAIGAAPNKYAQIARFRLGLLSIMQKDCGTAQKVMGRLSKMGANDYSSRALYWTAYCARTEAKKEEFLASFDELFRMNPLGFHTLSVTHGDSLLIENLSKPIDPIVKTRTSREGQFNVWINLIEEVDQLGEYTSLNRLLSPIRTAPDYIASLEPAVRLYLATFAYRAHDNISLFRVLDSVFRTQSEYVVDSTLRLFYPLRHMEKIASFTKKVNPILIASLIRQESAFQDGARSRVGAMGLMQLMPATARLMDRRVKRLDLLKPEVNIRLGVQYFEALVDRYSGDVELALAAYNAGAEVVDRWQKRYPVKNRLLFLDLIPFAETRNYVTLIGRNYYWYSQIYSDPLKSANGIAQSGQTEFRGMKSQ